MVQVSRYEVHLVTSLVKQVVFPLEVLPAWLRPIGFAMPITYWLELMRRSLIGEVAQAFPTLAQFSNIQLIGILLGLQNSDQFRRADDVDFFRGLGQRVSQLTYNSRNLIGNGSTERRDEGL